MYGIRAAADGWDNEYGATLEGMGFYRGIATPCTFYHSGQAIALVVYGDNFASVGTKVALDGFAKTACAAVRT